MTTILDTRPTRPVLVLDAEGFPRAKHFPGSSDKAARAIARARGYTLAPVRTSFARSTAPPLRPSAPKRQRPSDPFAVIAGKLLLLIVTLFFALALISAGLTELNHQADQNQRLGISR